MISPTRKRTLANKWKRLYAEKDREKNPRIALTYETPIARIEAEFAREDEHPRDWVTNEPGHFETMCNPEIVPPDVARAADTVQAILDKQDEPPMTEQDRKNLEHWMKRNGL